MMGDEAPAHHDRHVSTYTDDQQSAPMVDSDLRREKSFAASGQQSSGSPFYSQLDAYPQASPTAPQYGSHASFQPQQPMHRFDMTSMGAAMPDYNNPSTSHRNFAQQTPQYTREMSGQTPSMNFRPQAHAYGHQQYPQSMAMHVPMPHLQPHPQFVPQYYPPFAGPGSQTHMQSQGQPVNSYSTPSGMRYGKADVVRPTGPQAYLGTCRYFLAIGMAGDHVTQSLVHQQVTFVLLGLLTTASRAIKA
jgi:hypothetical protein